MSNYWLDRSISRLTESEQTGVRAIRMLLPLYNKALMNIESDLRSVYANYSDKVGLDIKQLESLLTGAERSTFLRDIQIKMKKMGFNVMDVYDKNYIMRITKLEAFKQQVYWEIQNIASDELRITEGAYKGIINKSYETSREDIRRHLGRGGAFSSLRKDLVGQTLTERWEGGNYSTRIWGNVSKLAYDVPTVLGAGMLKGEGLSKMTRELERRFDVGRYNVTRLVRTETNYFHTQAKIQSFKDEDVEFFEYIAVMDGRTSDLCEGLHGKLLTMEQVKEGFNVPPLHPNCRSDIRPAFLDEVKQRGLLSDEDVQKIHDEAAK
jgi:SPP1 gp7 family putative phage head morphogenesis protein